MVGRYSQQEKGGRPAGRERGSGWQAEKSAITRNAIMEAAVECLIELGYSRTTTALIAQYAGVSRGAMMHHFPSRISVFKALIAHLQEARLREYAALMENIDQPAQNLTRDDVYAGITAAWKYVNLPSFTAFQELVGASRTDQELRAILEPVEKAFEKQFIEAVRELFPHWSGHEFLETANDLVLFTMKGVAASIVAQRKTTRAKSLMNYLTDMIWAGYTQGTEQRVAS